MTPRSPLLLAFQPSLAHAEGKVGRAFGFQPVSLGGTLNGVGRGWRGVGGWGGHLD